MVRPDGLLKEEPEVMEKVFSRAVSDVSKRLRMILPACVRSALAGKAWSLSMSLARTRSPRIQTVQERLLKESYSPATRRLIVFLTPGFDSVNGGILSISSIYRETRKLKYVHGAETIMCTVPGDPLLLKYTKFENQNHIYSLSRVLSYFSDIQYVMIHVPEYAVEQFLKNLTYSDYSRIRRIRSVRLNIMLQNIDALSPMKYVEGLKRLGHLTCTTAHDKYSTLELSRELGFPLHKLSVYVSPEQYHKRSYSEKENLMIVSPDADPRKSAILDLIGKEFLQLKIQIIEDLTYEEYKKLISRAKWALTFGEGLDNYFIETVFSGGVSCSAYNSRFFTEDFKSLRTVYDNYHVLIKKICSDIKDLDHEMAFTTYQKEQYDRCSAHYNYGEYVKNLELFYQGKFTYS